MGTMTFDTLEYVNQLKAADVPEAQAQVQARALRQVLEGQSSVQASSADVKALEASTESKFDLLRKDIAAVEQRLDTKIDLLEQRTHARFTLLQWMLAGVLGGVGTILLKLFLG